jgi:hypothetical protein
METDFGVPFLIANNQEPNLTINPVRH